MKLDEKIDVLQVRFRNGKMRKDGTVKYVSVQQRIYIYNPLIWKNYELAKQL